MATFIPISTSPEEHSSNGHNHDALARGYIESLKRGESPVRPDVGRWEYLCDTLDIVKGDANAITKALESFKKNKKFPGLAELLSPPVANSSASQRHADEKSTSLEIVRDNDSPYPPLPEGIRLDPSLARGVCPLREEYIRYSEQLSPEGYEGFHDGVFWWMLSTVAARRVYADFSDRQYTPLYVILAARTSLYAKTVTANVGKKVLRAAGLDWLLGADRSTPHKLMSDMAGKYIPKDYNILPYDEQELLKLRLAMSGQLGWVNDEFGKFVKGMLRQNSVMNDYADLFLTFDGCPETYRNATIARSSEPISCPYLAMLGCMTPANVRDNAKSGAEFWGDGFWARFAFIIPPPDTHKDAPFTRGEKPVPGSLSTSLRRWHDRLGVPVIDIVPGIDDKGKSTGDYSKVPLQERKETKIEVSNAAYDAWIRYRSALKGMINSFPTEDLDGSYDRLPAKAIRVATLVASLQGSNQIELSHWALAQEVAENWRAALHHFYAQVNMASEKSAPTLDDKIFTCIENFINKNQHLPETKRYPTARDIARALHLTTVQIDPNLKTLQKSGVIDRLDPKSPYPRYKVGGNG